MISIIHVINQLEEYGDIVTCFTLFTRAVLLYIKSVDERVVKISIIASGTSQQDWFSSQIFCLFFPLSSFQISLHIESLTSIFQLLELRQNL